MGVLGAVVWVKRKGRLTIILCEDNPRFVFADFGKTKILGDVRPSFGDMVVANVEAAGEGRFCSSLRVVNTARNAFFARIIKRQ